MALNNVAVWNDGWKDITCEEAIRYHPYGTVSAKSGLFMCKLCHQYVTLANGYERKYFKHEKENLKSKNCPDKSNIFSVNQSSVVLKARPMFPLKINLDDNKVSFELGLYFFKGIYGAERVTITPKYSKPIANVRPFQYSTSSMELLGITYLSVGSVPMQSLTLDFYMDGRVNTTKEVLGIDPDGCLFDAMSKKMLPPNADVVLNHEYYLLVKKTPYSYKYVSISKVCDIVRGWKVFRVVATSFIESVARFFLDYGYVLTERAVDILPLWPTYTISPYLVNHISKQMFLYIQGEHTQNATFPYVSMYVDSCNDRSKIMLVDCKERQQLLSIGRNNNVLKSVYLLENPLDRQLPLPSAKVQDVYGNEYPSNTYETIPPHETLQITTPFDGKVKVYYKGNIKELFTIKANTVFQLYSISFGQKVLVCIGNDVVWSGEFEKPHIAVDTTDDILLLYRLNHCHGNSIPINSGLCSLAKKLPKSSPLRIWIYQKVRQGSIDEHAYKLIINRVTK